MVPFRFGEGVKNFVSFADERCGPKCEKLLKTGEIPQPERTGDIQILKLSSNNFYSPVL